MTDMIINDLSWIAHTAHPSSVGYLIELGDATISTITTTEGFSIGLSGGSRITFSISRRTGFLETAAHHELKTRGPVDTAFIDEMLNKKIREAIITPSGELVLGITGSPADLCFGVGEWKVSFPNGSSVISLREGGTVLLPPDSSSQ